MTDPDPSIQEFLARLSRLADDPAPTPRAEFLPTLKSLPNFTVAEWAKVVDFAADQLGRWEARWSFSPASSPDADAATETEAWRNAWSAFSKELVEQLPELDDLLRRKLNLVVLGHSLDRKLKNEWDKPIAKMMSAVLSHLAIVLNRVGWHGISHWLYSTALFPSGTVGRASKKQTPVKQQSSLRS